MNTVTDSMYGQGKQSWRQFMLLLLVFVVAMIVCGLLPTPGSWSDSRSQWLPPAVMGLTALSLFVASFWVYRRPGFIFKIQAVILWLLFGAVLIIAAYSVYESFTFLRDVRASHV